MFVVLVRGKADCTASSLDAANGEFFERRRWLDRFERGWRLRGQGDQRAGSVVRWVSSSAKTRPPKVERRFDASGAFGRHPGELEGLRKWRIWD